MNATAERDRDFYLDDLTVPDRTYNRLATVAVVRWLRGVVIALYLVMVLLVLILWRVW